MCGSGLPTVADNHAESMAEMAFAIAVRTKEFNARFKKIYDQAASVIKFKIGISSGRVVAGVIGKTKFTFGDWGDACNTASRMYSHGVKEKIHVTRSTRDLLRPKYILEERGEIMLKGKGLMTTYFLLRPRGANERFAATSEEKANGASAPRGPGCTRRCHPPQSRRLGPMG